MNQTLQLNLRSQERILKPRQLQIQEENKLGHHFQNSKKGRRHKNSKKKLSIWLASDLCEKGKPVMRGRMGTTLPTVVRESKSWDWNVEKR